MACYLIGINDKRNLCGEPDSRKHRFMLRDLLQTKSN